MLSFVQWLLEEIGGFHSHLPFLLSLVSTPETPNRIASSQGYIKPVMETHNQLSALFATTPLPPSKFSLRPLSNSLSRKAYPSIHVR
jgi:hypothetical protein